MAVKLKNNIEARVLMMDRRFNRAARPNLLKTFFKYILIYLPLIIWTIITAFPFWYMIVVSGLSRDRIFVFPPPLTVHMAPYKEGYSEMIVNDKTINFKDPDSRASLRVGCRIKDSSGAIRTIRSIDSTTQVTVDSPGLSSGKWFFPDPKGGFFPQFLNNYRILLSKTPYWRNMWNSVYIASMLTILSIFFCSLGGYGFAIYNFRGKKFLFTFMLISLMIPQLIGLVPYYIMMRAFGWINTAKAIYIPGIANAFGIFLMKQFIESSIPLDIIDAARVDGATEFSIFWRIIIPLIAPVIGSFAIITFLGSWNSYLGPLIIFNSQKTYTVPVALTTLRTLSTFEGDSMVATVIAVMPLLIVFILMSRMIIMKVTEGALKG
jgi:multiple sugar transport system permease protein